MQVIFDFDGTLVNSLPVALKILQQIMPNFELDQQQLEALRQMPARDVIKQSGLSRWRQVKLLVKGKKLLAQHVNELALFPGIANALKTLHQQGYQLSVVSSNSESTIRAVLKHQGVLEYFTGVYGSVGLFNKARVFKVVLKDRRASTKEAVYVGDEVRDIEAAHHAHIPVVAVSWGYNAQNILRAYGPEALVDTPKQLVQTITKRWA